MSASSKPTTVKCPSCKKTVAWLPEQQYRPFCSQRCKLIDLGEWAAEERRIPGEPVLTDFQDYSED